MDQQIARTVNEARSQLENGTGIFDLKSIALDQGCVCLFGLSVVTKEGLNIITEEFPEAQDVKMAILNGCPWVIMGGPTAEHHQHSKIVEFKGRSCSAYLGWLSSMNPESLKSSWTHMIEVRDCKMSDLPFMICVDDSNVLTSNLLAEALIEAVEWVGTDDVRSLPFDGFAEEVLREMRYGGS